LKFVDVKGHAEFESIQGNVAKYLRAKKFGSTDLLGWERRLVLELKISKLGRVVGSHAHVVNEKDNKEDGVIRTKPGVHARLGKEGHDRSGDKPSIDDVVKVIAASNDSLEVVDFDAVARFANEARRSVDELAT
jgi:hypothetical protein